MQQLLSSFGNPNSLIVVLFAIFAFSLVIAVGYPVLVGNNLERRMKLVAIERDKIRARERDRLARGERGNTRPTTQQFIKSVVDQLNLQKWLGQEDMRSLMVKAGMRGQSPYIFFLFFRMLSPIAAFLLAVIYFYAISKMELPAILKIALCVGIGYLGLMVPGLVIKNKIAKRQLMIKRSFPDALDLLLICVESGMSVEAAFKKVSQEIGSQSIALAEELTLTTAELSYLSERRQAFENLARRTDIEGVKAVCTALIQAERYGTPVGQALKVMAQENRDMRMLEAEKKAAGLPPKLTVPMILFFLPVLFIVILGPAAIQVMSIK